MYAFLHVSLLEEKAVTNLTQIKQTWQNFIPHELLYQMSPLENLSYLWSHNYGAFI